MRRIFSSFALLTFIFSQCSLLALCAGARAGDADDGSASGPTIATTGDGRWISVNPVLEVPQQCRDGESSDPKCKHDDASPASSSDSADSDASDSADAASAPAAAAAPESSIDASAADAGDSWSNPDASDSYDTASNQVPNNSPEVIVVPEPVAPNYGPSPYYGYTPYSYYGGYARSNQYPNGYNANGSRYANNLGPRSLTDSRRASFGPVGAILPGPPTGPAPHLTFPMH